MTFLVGTKDIKGKTQRMEREELEEYCKEQGYTPEQTKQFVENSMAKMHTDE